MPRKTRHAHPARPFVLTILILCAIAAFGYLKSAAASHHEERASYLVARGSSLLQWEIEPLKHNRKQDQEVECRLVHKAKPKDQCAFVLANCEEEDSGLFPYLQLYYCDLPNLKPVGFGIIVLWAAWLFTTIGVASSDFFCINLSTLSAVLGMSESMAGVTFLAFGNGSPDVFSTFAAMNTNSGSLAIGELIGAASFITAVVSASMAFVRPFKVARRSFIRDVCFFILAISFSMYFLANGKLELWESAVMVGFYIFYVMVVVGWHWILSRRKSRREAMAVMRGDYTEAHGELEAEEEYHDDPHEDLTMGSRQSSFPRIVTDDDFRDLEQADYEASQSFDDLEEEEAREQWMGELSQNMRVTRPPRGRKRSSTVITPIRPSLVGALEFQSVLSSLKKSRNIQTMPIHLRRYSDDPNFTAAQQHDTQSNIIVPESGVKPAPEIQEPWSAAPGGFHDTNLLVPDADVGRPRAMTADFVPHFELSKAEEGSSAEAHKFETPQAAQSMLEAPSPLTQSRDASPSAGRSRASTATTADGLLAPPDVAHGHRRILSEGASYPIVASPPSMSPSASPLLKPKLRITPPPSKYDTLRPSPRSPGVREGASARPLSPRPPSIRLPEAADELEPLMPITTRTEGPKPVKHWPYGILPRPEVLFSTLFPTLVGWSQKKVWEKILGLAAMPSFFLLTVTLPVVDPEAEPEETHSHAIMATPGPESSKSFFPENVGQQHHSNVASEAVSIEHRHAHSHSQQPNIDDMADEFAPVSANIHSPTDVTMKEWNRWLALVQCYTAPFFILLVIWAKLDGISGRHVLQAGVFCLLGSTMAMLLILFTTEANRPPKWHFLICFVGFAVSVAWISSIADEVVSVLKAIGVIFDISDAILGLTIFAVGNSLGDLVADITVARLGYPVMALSACFGGPMLNILLGIGLSGGWMILKKEGKYQRKHPNKAPRLKPFEIDVSWTLLISAIGLLVTLVSLLVLVPLNKWKMDRKIGFLLIGIWVAATTINVVLEVLGVADHWSTAGI